MREIGDHIGVKGVQLVREQYVQPLVANGKLQKIFPNYSHAKKQKYVVAGYEKPLPTTENILDYCREPRTRDDVAKHFEIAKFQALHNLRKLIAEGLLVKLTRSIAKTEVPTYVTADSPFPKTKEEALLRFCAEPRTRKEISINCGLHIKNVWRNIEPLIAAGKIAMTVPDAPQSPHQKFVTI